MMRKRSIAVVFANATNPMTARVFLIVAAALASAVSASPAGAQRLEFCQQWMAINVQLVTEAKARACRLSGALWDINSATLNFCMNNFAKAQFDQAARTKELAECRARSAGTSAPPSPSSVSLRRRRVCERTGGTWDFENNKCLRASASAPADSAPAPTPASETAPIPEPETAEADNTCGPTGGTAVVQIPEPHLDKLNVREKPGGNVLDTIPEGTEVSIVGPCGSEAAAGVLPQRGTTPGGWCQIDAPVSGCVSAKYLQFGGPGEAAGAAGLLRQRSRRH